MRMRPFAVCNVKTLLRISNRYLVLHPDFDHEPKPGDQLREKAHKFARMAQLCEKEKKHLFGKGDPAAAHAKIAEIKKWHQKMHEANAAAAEEIFNTRNSKDSECILDLHGLYKVEALAQVDRWLKSKKRGRVEIVTGIGYHSGGQPVLKPAVQKFLRARGLVSYEKADNAGTLVVSV